APNRLAMRPAKSTGCTKCCSTCRSDKTGTPACRDGGCPEGTEDGNAGVCTTNLLHASSAPSGPAGARRPAEPADRLRWHAHNVRETHSPAAGTISTATCPGREPSTTRPYAAWGSTRTVLAYCVQTAG